MYTLVLVRHGLSEWNKANLFTGWTDVDLHPEGEEQAREAGRLLKENGYEFDLAYTSYLTRATRTLDIIQDEMGTEVPVKQSWRLNERHYGALQGHNKAEMAEEVGAEQVHIWRRSFDVRPPALEEDDERHPKHDPKYSELMPDQLPATECLKDCLERVLPYWESDIVPDIKAGKRLIISAHGNSLRAIVKHLEGISDEEIPKLSIPTGVPRVYKLDENLKTIEAFYLEA